VDDDGYDGKDGDNDSHRDGDVGSDNNDDESKPTPESGDDGPP
jgi:hypothetical protein